MTRPRPARPAPFGRPRDTVEGSPKRSGSRGGPEEDRVAKGNGTPLTDELYAYMLGHNPPLDPVQRMLVEVTHTRLPLVAGKQVAEEQGPFLAFLVRLTGARRVVEIGTFTGLSALSMAQALPPTEPC